MNNILGQYSLGGRLGDSIRERQGMAYYVFSALDANVIPGPVDRPRRRQPGERRARGRLDRRGAVAALAAEGPTDKELRGIEAVSDRFDAADPRDQHRDRDVPADRRSSSGSGSTTTCRCRSCSARSRASRCTTAAARTLDPSRATVVVAGPYAGSLT